MSNTISFRSGVQILKEGDGRNYADTLVCWTILPFSFTVRTWVALVVVILPNIQQVKVRMKTCTVTYLMKPTVDPVIAVARLHRILKDRVNNKLFWLDIQGLFRSSMQCLVLLFRSIINYMIPLKQLFTRLVTVFASLVTVVETCKVRMREFCL